MPDLRQIILDRLKQLDHSIGWLAEHGDVSCGRQTVYDYLRHGRGISADKLAEMLDVLKLQVKPRFEEPPWLGGPIRWKSRAD